MASVIQDLEAAAKYLPLLISIESGQAQTIPSPEESFQFSAGQLGTFKVTIPAASVTIQKVG
ncbi:MAG TPA: hypothetical protein VIG51_03910 [Candidatus Baltobacteraceae bacterium]|jgi:hypothetical protein|nr:hypothetical protein [Candidatus Baltobacteraceae bacterium]